MKKYITIFVVALFAMFTTAQTNQYFWYNGNLMMGNPIAQIDSVTFGEGEPTDTLHILLPRTIIKEVHDTVEVAVHDTVYITNYTCLPEGALPGEFSVSPTKKVRFSKGNLWYNAMGGSHLCADGTTQKGIWKFAENQWDTIGSSQCNKSEFYDGWISVFSWGTSGWNSGANYYQPWEHSANDPYNYFVGGNQNNDLTGAYAYADWGVYNAISNGGNEPNQWRTLTKEEWAYLLYKRTNYERLCSYADVNGIEGLILLPDDFVIPDGINWTAAPLPDYEMYLNISSRPPAIPIQNHYTIADWMKMENDGAIFMPRDYGYLTELSLPNQPQVWRYNNGNYWSSSHRGRNHAWAVNIYLIWLHYWTYRCDSGCVRLVQDVE